MTPPKVSILIPSFKPRWFEEALTSALDQAYPNTEIIVSDDCPTDEIRTICARYGDRLTYVRNPTPGRAGFDNMMHLLRRADGDFVKFLFDDDVLHVDCVRQLAQALVSYPEAGLSFSLRSMIDEASRPLQVINYFGATPSGLLASRELVRFMTLQCINPIGELSTVMWRHSEAIRQQPNKLFQLGGADPCSLGDVACYGTLALRFPTMHFTNSVLSSFRVSAQQNSSKDSPVFRHSVTEWMLFMRDCFARGWISSDDARQSVEHFRQKWVRKYPSEPPLQALVQSTADEQLAWLARQQR